MSAGLAGYDYQERWVAFIDILGFKEHVKLLDQPGKLKELIDAVRGLNQGSEYYLWRTDFFAFAPGLKSTTFSDNIVISGESDELQYVLEMAGVLCRKLLAQGYMARGAVAYGKLHHSDNVLIGSGLVDAHKLESEVAKYPRIIIQDAGLEKSKAESTSFPIVRDYDGVHYLDYLSNSSFKGSVPLDKIRAQLEVTLASTEQTVIDKGDWMASYLHKHSYHDR